MKARRADTPQMKDLRNLLTNYSKLGMADWGKATQAEKQATTTLLKNRIVADHELATTINDIGTGADTARFIPMPLIGHSKALRRCFFALHRTTQDPASMCFDLLLCIDDDTRLAFRFEPPDLPGWAHSYRHVQMSRRMLRRTFDVSLPPWIPESFPAFPVRGSDPTEMFLTMLASVHGLGTSDGVREVLQNAFPNNSLASQRYFERLTSSLA